jgi:hypothetical protein
MHALTENDLDPVRALAEDYDVHGLPGLCYANLDLLVDHELFLSDLWEDYS